MLVENIPSSNQNLSNAFIDINNTLYVTDESTKKIDISPPYTEKRTISSNLTFSRGLFVTRTDDIYVDHGNHSQVTKWSVDTNQSSIIMYINRRCTSLFVASNFLYCSIFNGHLVITMALSANQSQLAAAAGTGCPGSALDMLNQPSGIYININMDLYVADTGNDRIQLFRPGQLTGTTVLAERDATVIFPLRQPTSVILDADDYLYIVDSGNQRIIRSGPSGSQCIIGCSIAPCSQSNLLCHPSSIIFSTDGSLYITDITGIIKFTLATNSCGKLQMHSLSAN